MRFSMTVSALLLASFGATGVLADSHGNEFVHSRTNNGQVYVMYQNHMSLYTFNQDEAGKSNCYGACAQTWPPALLPAGTVLGESYTLIPRTDGTMQAAFRGQPLYLYVGDDKIGDTNGDGVGNVWFLARPDF
ncbi:MAG: COG4315 family predicted lipoprotein [Alphaproteobacteria bacterium]